MIETRYRCDRCDKKTDLRRWITVQQDGEIWEFHQFPVVKIEIDLCDKCFEEFKHTIEVTVGYERELKARVAD